MPQETGDTFTAETYELLLSQVVESMDVIWLLLGAILIFYMQIGFAMLEVGAVVSSATKNVLMKNCFDAAVTSLAWGIVGNALAYGDAISPGNGWFFGTTGFFFGMETSGEYASWLFNWAFVATAATIVSGAVAERINFRVYVGFAFLLSFLTYPLVVRWAWSSDGFMSAFRDSGPKLLGCGVLDFAGSGVIHLTGGTAALVSVICLGPRTGVSYNNGVKTAPEGQSDILKVMGTFCLWFGWFAFNGMSTGAIVGSSRTAARAMVMTAVAGAVGGLASAVTHSKWEQRNGKGWDHTNFAQMHLTPALNGILAGLVGVTANCATIKIEGAIFIGIGSGMLYVCAEHILDHFQIDDVVSAVPVHLVSGIWGLIAGGLFTAPSYYQEAYGSSDFEKCAGIFYGGSGNQLGANIVFMLVTIPWNLATVGVLFVITTHFGVMRVSRIVEMVGIDTMHHNDGPSKIEDVEEDDSMDMVAKGTDNFGGFDDSPEPFGGPPMMGNMPPLNGAMFSQQPMNAFQEETKDAGTLLRASVVLTEVTDTSQESGVSAPKIKANAVAPL